MINGLIVDADYNNAENTKILMENSVRGLKMDIYEPRKKGMTMVYLDKYDFIMTAENPVKKHKIDSNVIPFVNQVIKRKKNYITLRKGKEILFIDKSAIVGIEVIGKICHIYTVDKRCIRTRITLCNLVTLLNDPQIVRCQKSFAINIRYINGIYCGSRNKAKPIFIAGVSFDCTISDRYLEEVVKAFEDYNSITVTEYVKI